MRRATNVLVCCCLWLLAPAPGLLAADNGAPAKAAAPLAFVTVAGAPGDGEEALAAALAKRLAAAGLKAATAFQADVYEIQGTVKVAPGAKGKESVSIIWVVLDPDGNQLGVVRQKQEVRKGSLDKKWGGAADAAAKDAAVQIVALFPRGHGPVD